MPLDDAPRTAAAASSDQAGHDAAAGGASGPASADGASPRRRPAYLEKGDVFRLLDLPGDFVVGLDAIAMTTRKSLPGFREIPPGAHFLWVQQPEGVSRCGYWFVTGRQGTVRVKQWDKYNEVLSEPAGQPAGRDDPKAGIESVYATLQPYTLHDRRGQTSSSPFLPANTTLPSWARSPALVWQALTWAISTRSLDRITGRRGAGEYPVDSMDRVRDPYSDGKPAAGRPDASGASGELNFLFARDIRDLRLLDLGAIKDRVADTDDTTARVLALLSQDGNDGENSGKVTERDVVAELQFAFLVGTHLSSTACLEHWWDLVLKIVLRAGGLAASRPRLARDLVQALHAQLFYTERFVGSSSSSSSSSSPSQQQQQGQSGAGGKDDTNDSSNTAANDRTEPGPSSDRLLFQYRPQNRARLRVMLARYRRRLHELLRGTGGGGGGGAELEAVGRAFEELEVWLWKCNWDLRDEGASEKEKEEEEEEEEKGKEREQRRRPRSPRDGRRERERGRGPDVDVDAYAAGDSEEEDDPPVVVEVDEQGREVGLVSFND